jgi:hypothetical protein
MWNLSFVFAKRSRRLVRWIAAAVLTTFFHVSVSYAQTSLNVTNFGAQGNAAVLSVSTVANSSLVTSATPLSTADIGKVIEIFGGGPLGSATTNCHQDLVAVIANVVNATNLYLDRTCGATSNACYGIYGLNNAAAFQACIDFAPSNSVINIPDGTYLIIGSQALDPNFITPSPYNTYPSITISKGGITLLGESRTNTVLMGCGAWQLKGVYAYRGFMFACQGPITNNGPLIFDSFTMDGGVLQGYTGYFGFPARTDNGDGWDVTHDAVIDMPPTPLHNVKIFRNCSFTRWRGEQVKSVAGEWDGFINVTNCSFTEGDASGINFSFTHDINDCYFSHLSETMEFYQGYCSNACYFRNCTVTNMGGAVMAINGALAGSPNPPYCVSNNIFYMQGGQNGIQTCPVQNLTIISNQFIGNGFDVCIGVAGYQGSTVNSNIVVCDNEFTNAAYVILVEGGGENALYNLLVSNNVACNTVGGNNAFAYGFGWGTNMVFVGNVISGLYGLNSASLSGQWFIDSFSNYFPTNMVTDSCGVTNLISYAYNGIDKATYISTAQPHAVVVDDLHPSQVPPRAAFTLTNMGVASPLYLSARMSGNPIMMSNGYSAKFYWNAMTSNWSLNNPYLVLPPSSLRTEGGW